MIDSLLQDLRYAVRALRARPGFTSIAVLTLAVGIGANTAIFSVVNATLLRTLPFRDPDALMMAHLTTPLVSNRPGEQGGRDVVWSYPKFETFRAMQTVFASVAAYQSASFNLTSVDDPERLVGEQVSATYFPTLGVEPEHGRVFRAEEDATPGTHPVALLGHALWLRHFGGDQAVLGKKVTLDAKSYTVVGILPAGFRGLTGSAELWVPSMMADAENMKQRWSHSWSVVARLKPGMSAARAKSQLALLGAQIDLAHKDPIGGAWGATARTLAEERVDPAIRKSVIVLFGAVAFVLLIACANIANLLLARATARRREIAVRLAVGASRGRLIQQLLTESTLLALFGALGSLALAYGGVRWLAAIKPGSVGPSALGPRTSGLTAIGLSGIRIDGTVLLFTLGIALVTGILFGLVPALQASRAGVTDALKEGGTPTEGLGGIRALTSRSVLVVGEVALALVLLVGSGLMIKSFSHLMATRIGIEADDVLTMRLRLPEASPGRLTSSLTSGQASSQTSSQAAFFDEVLARVTALPGVRSVGASNCTPLAGGCNQTLATFRDRPEAPRGTEPLIGVHFVSTGFFKTLGIPLLRGRAFEPTDVRGGPKVVVINESAARKLWPNDDPIGKRMGLGQGGFQDGAEIIGVVADVRYGAMDEPPKPDAYISMQQAARSSVVLYVRGAMDPASLLKAVRREIHAINANVPLYDVKSMRDRIGDATARARFSATLLAAFAGIALVLSAVGIYGVMSYLVTQRTREIGIRIALGAQRRDVMRLVVRRGIVLTSAGVVIGLMAALAVTRVLTSMLYDVTPSDPATFAVIALALAAVAMLASYIPARRATRVDPLVAMRNE